jgi:hypothetical protein
MACATTHKADVCKISSEKGSFDLTPLRKTKEGYILPTCGDN